MVVTNYDEKGNVINRKEEEHTFAIEAPEYMLFDLEPGAFETYKSIANMMK